MSLSLTGLLFPPCTVHTLSKKKEDIKGGLMTNGLEFQESLKAREKRTCWVEWTAGKKGGGGKKVRCMENEK